MSSGNDSESSSDVEVLKPASPCARSEVEGSPSPQVTYEYKDVTRRRRTLKDELQVTYDVQRCYEAT